MVKVLYASSIRVSGRYELMYLTQSNEKFRIESSTLKAQISKEIGLFPLLLVIM